ncbi:hypothetical protein OROHE_005503 [Orobanche hederae]
MGRHLLELLTESQSLWARMIHCCHRLNEEGGGGSRMGAETGRGWWGQVLRVTNVSFGEWFNAHLRKDIGNGASTKFWTTRWGGGPALRDRFPRLFHLSSNKDETIGEMGLWEGAEWKWRLDWRRTPRGREDDARRELEEWLSGRCCQGRGRIRGDGGTKGKEITQLGRINV